MGAAGFVRIQRAVSVGGGWEAMLGSLCQSPAAVVGGKGASLASASA